jgi:predicted MPP superfamily phosphohydrolase
VTGRGEDAISMQSGAEVISKRRIFKIYKIGIIAILVFLVLFGAFYNGLVVRKYTLESTKINAKNSIRIVLISDLHSHIYGKNQSELVSIIKAQKPDIIALTGDIADDVDPIDGTKQFLAGIKGMAPTYYVTGNHEFWSNDINNIRELIKGYGVTILKNNYKRIKIKDSNLLIAGIDDPQAVRYEKTSSDWGQDMYKAFNGLDSDQEYKILLAHRPEYIETYKKYSFDLVLSGHAHGGQVRIPLILNGLFAPNQGWFPKYAGGVYKHDALTHIVSRGLSYNPRLPRVFNPPEVVVINIKGKL